MIKTIYSAKPHKDGYKISRYEWENNRYKDIKGIIILADKESAKIYILTIQKEAIEKGFKTAIEETQKCVYLTIEGIY